MSESRLTSEDRKRIQQYLKKPRYEREAADLVPDDDAENDD
jgi:hypothetical protein